MGKYDEIINIEYNGSKRKKKMSISDRAAQFASFAALTGHAEAIRETARLTERRIELDEYEKMHVNDKLNLILSKNGMNPEISVTYYVPDKKKQGGSYVSHKGKVYKIDEVLKIIIFSDGTEINIDDVINIDLIDS